MNFFNKNGEIVNVATMIVFDVDISQGSIFQNEALKNCQMIIAKYAEPGESWFMDVISTGGYSLMTYNNTSVGVDYDKSTGKVTNRFASGMGNIKRIIGFK